jgi:hypothetical protein
MIILDLFSGLGGERRRSMVEARGHKLITLDLDGLFGTDIKQDIMVLKAEHFAEYGKIDFVWASPPCEAFSVASIGHHWTGGKEAYIPKTQHAWHSQKLVTHTINLILALNPTYGWIMENPRGVLRKLPCVSGLPLHTVTYCQYGHSSMKPTDLWGSVPNWTPREMCKNGDECHERAPRGAKTGTQGIKGAAERAVVPIALWEEILDCLEKVESVGQQRLFA